MTLVAPAAALAAPAIAQSAPVISWRMQSSFSKLLDTVFGGATYLSQRFAKGTDGKFDIQVLDGVQIGTIDAGHTAGFYYIGESPDLCFGASVPFGLTPRRNLSWMRYGGGLELMRELWASTTSSSSRAATPAPRWAAGSGRESSRRGPEGPPDAGGGLPRDGLRQARPRRQQIPAGDIYTALERGTIDAVEWVGPYDDDKLGLNNVALYHYGSGVMELGASLYGIVNVAKWNELPPLYRKVFESASAEAHMDMLAKYDAYNMAALRRLLAAGTQLRFWPADVMRALQKAISDSPGEIAAKDATFARIYGAWTTFRDE